MWIAYATPAQAQEHFRFAGFDGPRGANATINVRIPFGTDSPRSRPTVGIAIGFGRTIVPDRVEGRPFIRQVRLADFRFSEAGLGHLRIAGFDLANLDQNGRLHAGPKSKSAVVGVGAVAVAAAVCLAAGCLDDDSDETSDSEPTGPTSG
jgi:hypothetical protein